MTNSGGGGVPTTWQLTPWTPVDQMGTWAPTAAYALDRGLECFQACLVSVLRWATGVWTSAAYLDQLVHDPSVPQGTTWPQALALLADNETRGQLVYPANLNEYAYLVRQSISNHHPCIPLRYWRTVGSTILHFVVLTGYTPNGVQLMDPDGGLMKVESWQQQWDMYAGDGLLLVQRKRMLGDH